MKHCVRRFSALVLSVALVFSMAVSASAMISDYRINVTADKQVQFLQDDQVKGRYAAYRPDLTIKKNKSGGLSISFQSATRSAKNVSLGGQDTLQITGELGNLTIDRSVDSGFDIVFTGAADTVTILGSTNLSISGKADVSTLKVQNAAAQVVVEKSAMVQEAYAVDRKSITGLRNINGTTAPSSGKTTSGTTEKNANVQGQIETVLSIEERDKDTMNSKEYSVDSEYAISVTAKTGMSLGAVMRDFKLSVERTDTNNKVGGTWNWSNAEDYNTTTSGVYYYQFKPAISQYGTINLKVNFTGNGSSRTMSKPRISFADGQRSHGAEGTVDITVSFPSQVEDDDELILFVDNKEVEKSSLSESDAGESQDFTVSVSGAKDDKIKIKARINLAIGGGKVSSSTITYQIS